MRSKDPDTRRHVIEGLTITDDPRAIELLKEALEDAELDVREAAAARLGESRATQVLTGALHSPRIEVREAAIKGLGCAGEIGALVPLLRDFDSRVRAGAAASLRKLGWKPESAEDQALLDVAAGKTKTAALAGNAAVTPLVQELKHDTAFVRRAVAEALESVDDPRTVKPLLAAVADPDPTVRVSVIHALRKVASEPQTLALLKKLARDRDANVRLAAAQVLAQTRSLDHIPAFLSLLRDSDFQVRQAAAEFLGKSGDPKVADALAPMLSDPDSDVRQTAAKGLGELGGISAIGALVLAVADEDSGVRQAAELALSRIDPHWTDTEPARSVRNQLEQILQRRPAWVRAAASHVLQRLQVPAHPPAHASA